MVLQRRLCLSVNKFVRKINPKALQIPPSTGDPYIGWKLYQKQGNQDTAIIANNNNNTIIKSKQFETIDIREQKRIKTPHRPSTTNGLHTTVSTTWYYKSITKPLLSSTLWLSINRQHIFS